MAFDKAMKMMGKPPKKEHEPKEPKGEPRPEPKPGKVGGEEGESHQTVITHHPDGSHEVDGEHHPSHLHLLAHLGHKLTGGDKHHVLHHDGMQAHSHMIHEDGQHEEGGSHNSADEAKQSLDKFFSEEAAEPEHQGHETGGMGAY